MRIQLRNQQSTTSLQEKLLLKDWKLYLKLVAEAYDKAPITEERAYSSYEALNQHSYIFFKRSLSKLDLSFYTTFPQEYKRRRGLISLGSSLKPSKGKSYATDYPLELIDVSEEYATAKSMRDRFNQTGKLRISIDYSEHPFFAVNDNLVFRTVHDYIVHILGGHEFGDKGEIASYNLHAHLCPPSARPALFTEIVGQVGYNVIYGDFPKQKAVILDGFDYEYVGKIDDENYEIVNKELVKKIS